MEDLNYPSLFAELEETARTAANLNATLMRYAGKEKPGGVDLWTQTMSRYVHLMFYLFLFLVAHAEWAEEADCMFRQAGCPAQRIPLIEQFFVDRRITPNEGMAL